MGMNYTKELVRRSRLIMPAHIEKYVAKAYMRNADVVVLDLEDSVPEAEKEAARKSIKESVKKVGKGGSAVFVRVNNEEEYLKKDIEAAVWPGLEGIYVPKVESAEEINRIDKLITELEVQRGIKKGSIYISVLIETCLGYLHMEEIVQSSSRIDSVSLGNEDFLKDMGAAETPKTTSALMVPRIQVVLVGRAYKKVPMGLIGSLADYKNEDAFAQSALRAYSLGFLGASCINPKNVETLNVCFSPSKEDVKHAETVKAAFESSLTEGKASAVFEGKMIDYAHYYKAMRLLEREQVIEEYEIKKKAARTKCMEEV